MNSVQNKNGAFISVITISYNNYTGLKQTLDSVFCQTYKDYEYIIIDGGSSDGSKELLEDYKQRFQSQYISYTYVSERDSGIYNAMNKGIRQANGKWVIFMNSGDVFADINVLSDIFRDSDFDSYDVIYGDFYFKDKNSALIDRKSEKLEKINKSLITCHQAIFTKSSLLKKRPFSEKYHIIADYEWYLNAYQQEKKFYYIPRFVCIFDGGGISSNNNYKVFCECLAIRKEHGVLNNPEFIIKLKKAIMYLMTRIKDNV